MRYDRDWGPRRYHVMIPGRLAWGAAVLVLTGPVPTSGSAQQIPAAAALVFDRVTVVDVEHGTLVPDQRVVIVGNRIRTVGAAGAVTMPPAAQVVDARGKYLIPGLWDLHVHSAPGSEREYPLFIAQGVTGIRDAGSKIRLDSLRLLRQEILAGQRVGPPRQILSGRSIRGPLADCDRGRRHREGNLETCVTDPADARHVVDSLKAAGADMIKPRDVTRELYFAIAAEARRLGIPFGGHAEEATTLEASDSGARIVDHPSHRTADKLQACLGASATLDRCRATAGRLRRNGTWLVPTLLRTEGTRLRRSQAVIRRFRQVAAEFRSDSGRWPQGNWLRDAGSVGETPTASSSGSTADSSGVLHVVQRAGVPILAGTDAGADFPLHVELAIYVAEGLTPLNALQSATLNPAKMLGGIDSLGTVAAGKLADLVLLDADPLADITNTTTIRAVVANGRYFDRAALDQLLSRIQSSRRALAAERQRENQTKGRQPPSPPE